MKRFLKHIYLILHISVFAAIAFCVLSPDIRSISYPAASYSHETENRTREEYKIVSTTNADVNFLSRIFLRGIVIDNDVAAFLIKTRTSIIKRLIFHNIYMGEDIIYNVLKTAYHCLQTINSRQLHDDNTPLFNIKSYDRQSGKDKILAFLIDKSVNQAARYRNSRYQNFVAASNEYEPQSYPGMNISSANTGNPSLGYLPPIYGDSVNSIVFSAFLIGLLLIGAGFIGCKYCPATMRTPLPDRENYELRQQLSSLYARNKELEHTNYEIENHLSQAETESARLRKKIAETERHPEQGPETGKEERQAARERIELFNSLLAREISNNEAYSRPYDMWIERIKTDREKFMNTNRLAFKASHPEFMKYLEAHGLTEAEINYLCLYAIGLRGKEVGEYLKLRRHYNISSEIRRKLGIGEHDTNIGIYVRRLMKE